jgi:hypothetical protein
MVSKKFRGASSTAPMRLPKLQRINEDKTRLSGYTSLVPSYIEWTKYFICK